MDDEIPLLGGTANPGRIVRIGSQVARPNHPQTPTVNAFLTHLRNSGIDWVPEPLGLDSSGRQRLRWIDGTAPDSPAPAWAFDDGLLADVAAHQRRLHDAARSFVAPSNAEWATTAGAYFPASADGTVVCHNDLCMPNVIVDLATRRVAGIVDFDYCRPVTPLFDIAVAIRHWAPIGDPFAAGVPSDLDRVGRFGTYCDIHALTSDDRVHITALIDDFLSAALINVRRFAAEGHVGFAALIDRGYEEANERARAWLSDNVRALVATGRMEG